MSTLKLKEHLTQCIKILLKIYDSFITAKRVLRCWSQVGKDVAGTGVGPYVPHEDFIQIKAYYQWVPFVLFLQAIMFYVPHVIFKWAEGGKVKVIFGSELELPSLMNYYSWSHPLKKPTV